MMAVILAEQIRLYDYFRFRCRRNLGPGAFVLEVVFVLYVQVCWRVLEMIGGIQVVFPFCIIISGGSSPEQSYVVITVSGQRYLSLLTTSN